MGGREGVIRIEIGGKFLGGLWGILGSSKIH